MKTNVFRALRRVVLLSAVVPYLAACQVLPPPHGSSARAGLVRAPSVFEAERVAEMLDRLTPLVRARLPDSAAGDLEVWIQDSPALYRFGSSTYNDADGFWAAAPHRIHLRRRADNLERTLAHELVHASLGPSWRALPGTIEEGLCDAISAELCPGGAARMRAGRLSSASFATGGLLLDLELALPAELHPLGLRLGFHARMRLEGDPPASVDPLDVFEVEAGLSSATISGDRKKAFYGLSYLVVDRILARHGVEGLHALCTEALARGLDEVPREELLASAGLDLDPATWRRALHEALGPAELAELVRMHPRFLAETVAGFLEPYLEPGGLEAALGSLEARLRLSGGEAEIALLDVAEVRRSLAELLPDGVAPVVAAR